MTAGKHVYTELFNSQKHLGNVPLNRLEKGEARGKQEKPARGRQWKPIHEASKPSESSSSSMVHGGM